MKPAEFRALAAPDLTKRLEESYEELRNLRFQHATRQLTNTSRFGVIKRDIARIKTIIRERELAEVANA